MSKICENECNVCGKTFKCNCDTVMVCPDCRGNPHKALNRIFTKDTVFFVCKWYDEGMSIEKIADILHRSESNIIKALKEGGKLNEVPNAETNDESRDR